MKLKAKGNSDAIIEKFSAQSSKSAKFAKTTIKKREVSEAKTTTNNPTTTATAAIDKKPESVTPVQSDNTGSASTNANNNA